jgi:hypothetical protein
VQQQSRCPDLPLPIVVYGIIGDKAERSLLCESFAGADRGGTMSVWPWIVLGIIGFFAVSLLVGLFVAAILANIGREFSAFIEFEPLESPPLTDPAESTSETAEEQLAGRRSTA